VFGRGSVTVFGRIIAGSERRPTGARLERGSPPLADSSPRRARLFCSRERRMGAQMGRSGSNQPLHRYILEIIYGSRSEQPAVRPNDAVSPFDYRNSIVIPMYSRVLARYRGLHRLAFPDLAPVAGNSHRERRSGRQLPAYPRRLTGPGTGQSFPEKEQTCELLPNPGNSRSHYVYWEYRFPASRCSPRTRHRDTLPDVPERRTYSRSRAWG